MVATYIYEYLDLYVNNTVNIHLLGYEASHLELSKFQTALWHSYCIHDAICSLIASSL